MRRIGFFILKLALASVLSTRGDSLRYRSTTIQCEIYYP